MNTWLRIDCCRARRSQMDERARRRPRRSLYSTEDTRSAELSTEDKFRSDAFNLTIPTCVTSIPGSRADFEGSRDSRGTSYVAASVAQCAQESALADRYTLHRSSPWTPPALLIGSGYLRAGISANSGSMEPERPTCRLPRVRKITAGWKDAD